MFIYIYLDAPWIVCDESKQRAKWGGWYGLLENLGARQPLRPLRTGGEGNILEVRGCVPWSGPVTRLALTSTAKTAKQVLDRGSWGMIIFSLEVKSNSVTGLNNWIYWANNHFKLCFYYKTSSKHSIIHNRVFFKNKTFREIIPWLPFQVCGEKTSDIRRIFPFPVIFPFLADKASPALFRHSTDNTHKEGREWTVYISSRI